MSKNPTRRVGETDGNGVIKGKAIRSIFPGPSPVASTAVPPNSSSIFPVVQTHEHAVSRQEAELFLNKLARTYLLHARILVKAARKTEPPQIITDLIDPHSY